uniref:Uncharacterized protein n=2 Tax=Helianthus annuus TaxID=4232 RepID=A0A251T2Q7_HELAN
MLLGTSTSTIRVSDMQARMNLCCHLDLDFDWECDSTIYSTLSSVHSPLRRPKTGAPETPPWPMTRTSTHEMRERAETKSNDGSAAVVSDDVGFRVRVFIVLNLFPIWFEFGFQSWVWVGFGIGEDNNRR